MMMMYEDEEDEDEEEEEEKGEEEEEDDDDEDEEDEKWIMIMSCYDHKKIYVGVLPYTQPAGLIFAHSYFRDKFGDTNLIPAIRQIENKQNTLFCNILESPR